ncbi:peptidylprolyl isomerase [Pararhodospirillum oryzae]|uniref:Parvulin-like PPIase n=1 Tax=Pararhodospirillum oryzae TaxID=478448 RepID=A0A512H5G6_9PROT|nr:peptidyl-prolyl cis-trans isomerase [Pararhodospirillum oryzae]GEO80677.1 hypothetical protein ROR02_08080 [Pararhodospirillum oryzae]
MLDALRRGSKSWIAKTLLGLLVLSFGIWGVADYVVRGHTVVPAVVVGDQAFSAERVREQFNNDLSRLRRQGLNLPTEQAIALGFLDQSVRGLVNEAVLTQGAQAFGLTATDETLRTVIHTDPLFQDASGRFDRDKLARILAANGLSEAGYVEARRQELVRTALLRPVADGVQPPAFLVDTLARHASERREGQVLRLTDQAVPQPPAEPADPAVLEAVYTKALARFTTPEQRTATIVPLTAAAVARDIDVPDDAIQEAYDARADQYMTAASRAVSQSLFPSREAAQQALAAIRAGQSLADATRAQGGTGPVDMGTVTRETLPAPLAEPLFAQAVGIVGEPVEDDFGWHLFLVSADTPESLRPLSEVRAEIRASLAEDRALEALYTLSTRIEDALAGGASLEDAAAQIGVTPIQVTLDRQGNGPDGAPVADLPGGTDTLDTVFSLKEGETGPMKENDRGYTLVRLDHVTPATPRPLADVRADVVALWQAQSRIDALQALAQTLTERAQAGESLDALAKATPGSVLEPVPAVVRGGRTGLAQDDARADLDPAVIKALFETEVNGVARVLLPEGAAVLQVTGIHPPSPEVAAAERKILADQISRTLSNDLLDGYVQALAGKIGVTIHQDVIRDALQPGR